MLTQKEQKYLDSIPPERKTYRAILIGKYGYLNDSFIEDLACRRFHITTEQLEKIVGRYIKGKRKGLLKGKLVWEKCIRGGWVKTGKYDADLMHAHGFVASPGKTYYYKIVDSWTEEEIYDPKTPY